MGMKGKVKEEKSYTCMDVVCWNRFLSFSLLSVWSTIQSHTLNTSSFSSRRLLVVADISCDVNGSIEFLERTTTIDKPYFTYDPLLKREVSNDVEEYGVTMIGVDILPSELPIESSTHFGNSISQLVNEFVSIASNTNTITSSSSASEDEEDEKFMIDLSKLSPRLVRIQSRLSIVRTQPVEHVNSQLW